MKKRLQRHIQHVYLLFYYRFVFPFQRLPYGCQVRGHDWQSTKKHGEYRCANCKARAYCQMCYPNLAFWKLGTFCEKHLAEKAGMEAR